MLGVCAQGYRIEMKLHFRWVYLNGLIYRTLPKHDEIEMGHVRKMIRFLGIDPDCAKKNLAALGGR